MQKSEFTWQSVVTAFFVSAVLALAYPYIVLKVGMGPNMSVLAAMLGAVVLPVLVRRKKGEYRYLNNVVQTMATSAVGTAFMCVVAAAFGYLNMNEAANVHVAISGWQMFTWLSCSGVVGVFVAALFRRYFVDDPKMVFADGVAAARTIEVLDAPETETGGQAEQSRFMLWAGAGTGIVVSMLRDAHHLLRNLWFSQPFFVGIEWSVLSAGTGMLIGVRVALSMLLGLEIMYLFGPFIVEKVGLQIVHATIAAQYIGQCDALVTVKELTEAQAKFVGAHCGLLGKYRGGGLYTFGMLWLMWPATALMLGHALTAVAIRWKSIVAMFAGMRGGGRLKDEVSLWTIVGWSVIGTAVLAVVQQRHFGLPPIQTVASVVLGLPLILVGVRVLGETNNGPVSLMANAAQALFRLFSPNVAHNLVAAGMAGDINSQGEGTTQCYKTGKLIGSTPRALTWAAVAGIPIGAAAVAIMYPILVARYPLGEGLTAPTGLKLANMAVILSKGTAALPSGAVAASIIAFLAGIGLCLLEEKRRTPWLPSIVGVGFGMILPGFLTIPIVMGAIAGWYWKRRRPEGYQAHYEVLASGFIGGEAIVAGVILPLLALIGVLK